MRRVCAYVLWMPSELCASHYSILIVIVWIYSPHYNALCWAPVAFCSRSRWLFAFLMCVNATPLAAPRPFAMPCPALSLGYMLSFLSILHSPFSILHASAFNNFRHGILSWVTSSSSSSLASCVVPARRCQIECNVCLCVCECSVYVCVWRHQLEKVSVGKALNLCWLLCVYLRICIIHRALPSPKPQPPCLSPSANCLPPPASGFHCPLPAALP